LPETVSLFRILPFRISRNPPLPLGSLGWDCCINKFYSTIFVRSFFSPILSFALLALGLSINFFFGWNYYFAMLIAQKANYISVKIGFLIAIEISGSHKVLHQSILKRMV
jgi:hypothetical protein